MIMPEDEFMKKERLPKTVPEVKEKELAEKFDKLQAECSESRIKSSETTKKGIKK